VAGFAWMLLLVLPVEILTLLAPRMADPGGARVALAAVVLRWIAGVATVLLGFALGRDRHRRALLFFAVAATVVVLGYWEVALLVAPYPEFTGLAMVLGLAVAVPAWAVLAGLLWIGAAVAVLLRRRQAQRSPT
jgi:hypothetical protein